MIWSEIVTVNSHDCDKNRILRPTGLFRIVQEAAAHQLSAIGQDEGAMHAAHRAYIVSRIGIDVFSPIYINDLLTVRTWEANSSGAKFMRYYSVLRGGGEVACGACICALVDTETGRIMRLADSGYCFGGVGEERVPLLDSHDAMLKSLTFEKVADYPVLYTFIDRNDHMNNTCYADMFYSSVPGCAEKYMKSISISYLRQAKPGETLQIEHAERDGVDYFKSFLPDGSVCSVAAVRAENVK